jgi:starch synthase
MSVHRAFKSSIRTFVVVPRHGQQIPTILTIHNLAYQGLFSRETLARIGAPQNAYSIEGVEFYDKVSFLKAGIVYASHLTTVSQTYARRKSSTAVSTDCSNCVRPRTVLRAY